MVTASPAIFKVWSRGHSRISVDTNCVPGLSRKYSAYGSDPPLADDTDELTTPVEVDEFCIQHPVESSVKIVQRDCECLYTVHYQPTHYEAECKQ